MNFNLKKPCKDCPFRTDNDFALDTNRVDEISSAVAYDNKTFACHKTTHHDDDTGDATITRKTEHCAGALIMAAKMGVPNAMLQIAERFKLYDPTQIDMTAPVFKSAGDMVKAYKQRNGV